MHNSSIRPSLVSSSSSSRCVVPMSLRRAGPHRDHDQRHRHPGREPDVESGWLRLLRQHGEGHDLSRGAGRGTSRTVDSGLDRRSDQRARRARGRQDQHAVGLPELHRRPRRRAGGRSDGAALVRSEERRRQGHLQLPQQWRRLQRHGRGAGRHGVRDRIIREPHPSAEARREGTRPVGAGGSAAGRCRRHCDPGRWRGVREHLLRRPAVPHSGERRRQRRRPAAD